MEHITERLTCVDGSVLWDLFLDLKLANAIYLSESEQERDREIDREIDRERERERERAKNLMQHEIFNLVSRHWNTTPSIE